MTTTTNITPENSLTPAQQQYRTVRDMISSRMVDIKSVLPNHMNADHMVRVFLNSIQRTPALLECTPISLLGALILCSQFGLEPDGLTRQAYLIPFNNSSKGVKEVQVIIGYGGLVDMARRSGEISAIEARVIREKDKYSMTFGTISSVEHTPYTGAGEAGEPIGFYAVAHYKNGHTHYDHMTKADVDKIRSRSKASNGGPWVTDYIEMGKKTVIRRLCKLLPSSVQLQRAVTIDEKVDIGIAQDLAILADPNEKPSDQVVAEAADLMPKREEPAKEQEAASTGNANKTDRSGMRQMATHFPGKCLDCSKQIFKGDQVFYNPENKKVYCIQCPG